MIRKLAAYSLLLVVILIPKAAFAQNNLDLTYTYVSADEKAVSGDIIETTDKGFTRSAVAYTPRIFGVLQKEPTVVYKTFDDKELPIIRSGITTINVTNLNGPIKKGDYITSSPIEGKGQKSSQSGYTVGVSLEDFDGNAGEKIDFDGKQYTLGQIQTAIRIEFTELGTPKSAARLLDMFNISLFQNLQDSKRSVELIKYFAALVVTVVSVVLGFLAFARSIPKSIEALGRNPLAKGTIQFSIILSIILTVLTSLLGIIAAFIILRV